MVITADDTLTQFSKAVAIARRMPSVGPQGYHSVWPEILRLGATIEDNAQLQKQSASASEMAEYQKIASWMGFVSDSSVRRMIWAYSAGMPGWKIAKVMTPKISQSTVHRRILSALIQIADQLSAGEMPPEILYEENSFVP